MQITSDPSAASTYRDTTPAPYSEAWWASLAAEDLHDVVKRGFAAGDLFYAAVAETKRREEKVAEIDRLGTATQTKARRRIKRLGVVGLIGAAIVILIVAATVVTAVF